MVLEITDYFSTHGCSAGVSFLGGALDELAPLAAASFRALRSKKLIIQVFFSVADVLWSTCLVNVDVVNEVRG